MPTISAEQIQRELAHCSNSIDQLEVWLYQVPIINVLFLSKYDITEWLWGCANENIFYAACMASFSLISGQRDGGTCRCTWEQKVVGNILRLQSSAVFVLLTGIELTLLSMSNATLPFGCDILSYFTRSTSVTSVKHATPLTHFTSLLVDNLRIKIRHYMCE